MARNMVRLWRHTESSLQGADRQSGIDLISVISLRDVHGDQTCC